MMKKTKQLISEYYDVDLGELTGSLKEILFTVQDWIERFGDSAYLNISHGWDADIDFEIEFERLETDKEFEKRLKKEEKDLEKLVQKKIDLEHKERKELQRLLKKYGDAGGPP